jgi:ATP-dependent RNA helicase SUPV3L1/SUV3
MFNNRLGNVKFLIATDAIGMGLNLNIQRVIFSSLEKTLRRGKRGKIDEHTLKQIAGRAGRYTQDGLITAFSQSDL